MNKKNYKEKRNFIPQSIGDTLKNINKKFSSKFGKIEFIIQSKWPEIAGSYFTEYSEPKNISRLVDYENDYGEVVYKNHLNVSVSPAAALEFQHFKDTILEKINSYFGYKAIVDLRIQQNYISKYNNNGKITDKKKVISDMEKTIITNEVKKLENIDLKKSLFNLGLSIIKENK